MKDFLWITDSLERRVWIFVRTFCRWCAKRQGWLGAPQRHIFLQQELKTKTGS